MRGRDAGPGTLVAGLWVVRRGSGRPLVLLHGNGEDHHVFDRVLPALAPGRALVGIDSRAHGRSPRGEGPLTIASMADDVAAALSALGLDRVDVLGYSDGGNVALELAVRHPGRAGRVVVCGANLDPTGLRPGALRAMVTARRALHLVSGLWRGAARRIELLDLMVDDPHLTPADLSRVTVPVLVVVGEHDVVRPEHSWLIADSLPAGRLVVVAGAAHAVPQRRPAALARLVDDFLGVPDAGAPPGPGPAAGVGGAA